LNIASVCVCLSRYNDRQGEIDRLSVYCVCVCAGVKSYIDCMGVLSIEVEEECLKMCVCVYV